MIMAHLFAGDAGALTEASIRSRSAGQASANAG
jgi:hypothetical protein